VMMRVPVSFKAKIEILAKSHRMPATVYLENVTGILRPSGDD
jgi:hypothetical protein